MAKISWVGKAYRPAVHSAKNLVRPVARTIQTGGKTAIKTARSIGTSLKLGALGGLAAFFGLEWLTNGGLVRAVSGTLNVPDWMGTIIIVAACLVFGGAILYYFLGRGRKKKRK